MAWLKVKTDYWPIWSNWNFLNVSSRNITENFWMHREVHINDMALRYTVCIMDNTVSILDIGYKGTVILMLACPKRKWSRVSEGKKGKSRNPLRSPVESSVVFMASQRSCNGTQCGGYLKRATSKMSAISVRHGSHRLERNAQFQSASSKKACISLHTDSSYQVMCNGGWRIHQSNLTKWVHEDTSYMQWRLTNSPIQSNQMRTWRLIGGSTVVQVIRRAWLGEFARGP